MPFEASVEREWRVSLVLTGPEDGPSSGPDTDHVVEAVASGGARDVIIMSGPGHLGLFFTVEADGAWDAGRAAERLWASLAPMWGASWSLQGVRAATPDQIRAENELARFPRIMGVAEAAALLGVSKQRVVELRRDGRLPREIAQLASGPVWIAEGLEQFKSEWRSPAALGPGDS